MTWRHVLAFLYGIPIAWAAHRFGFDRPKGFKGFAAWVVFVIACAVSVNGITEIVVRLASD